MSASTRAATATWVSGADLDRSSGSCLQLHQDPEVLRTGLLPVPAQPGEAGKDRQGALPTLLQATPGLLYGPAPQVYPQVQLVVNVFSNFAINLDD